MSYIYDYMLEIYYFFDGLSRGYFHAEDSQYLKNLRFYSIGNGAPSFRLRRAKGGNAIFPTFWYNKVRLLNNGELKWRIGIR